MTRGFAVNDTFGDDPTETYNMARPRVSRLARFGRIDRSGSPRLTQVSFNRHFALATPCAHVPGRYAEPSHFKIGMAHPWSWAIGSSTSAA
jgi:hypothetical protein